MKVRGTVFRYKSDVDTDVIIPARYLNTTSEAELASHCMEDIDKDFVKKVKKGDLLISFDREAIQAEGYLCTTPLIVCNTDDYSAVKPLASGSVQPGQDLLQLDGGAQA